MTRVLLETEIIPAYSQVGAWDFDDKQSYPEWDEGRTDYSQRPSGVAVATQDDLDGRVKVVVTAGLPASESLRQTDMEEICTVRIAISQGHLAVGNGVADDIHILDVGRGTHAITVFGNVRREGRANSLLIALDPAITALDG
jgi:hypothetical protein